jgi:hypothetical protein
MGVDVIGDPWTEGWRTGIKVDYVNDLGVAFSQFDDSTMAEGVALITNTIDVGAIVVNADPPPPAWLLSAFKDHPF